MNALHTTISAFVKHKPLSSLYNVALRPHFLDIIVCDNTVDTIELNILPTPTDLLNLKYSKQFIMHITAAVISLLTLMGVANAGVSSSTRLTLYLG
jgi:hypothetical protein